MKCSTEWLSYSCKHNEVYMSINHCTFSHIDKVQNMHREQEEEIHMAYHLCLKPKSINHWKVSSFVCIQGERTFLLTADLLLVLTILHIPHFHKFHPPKPHLFAYLPLPLCQDTKNTKQNKINTELNTPCVTYFPPHPSCIIWPS